MTYEFCCFPPNVGSSHKSSDSSSSLQTSFPGVVIPIKRTDAHDVLTHAFGAEGDSENVRAKVHSFPNFS